MSASEPSAEQEPRNRAGERVIEARYATDEELLALPGAEDFSNNQQPKIDHEQKQPN